MEDEKIKETTMSNALDADNVQKLKSETPQNRDAYRAPRLVSLGRAAGLVQFAAVGKIFDSNTGNSRDFRS